MSKRAAKYAYSLNGENYQGSFDTREAAVQAAIDKSSGAADPPASVFVGEIVSGNPQTVALGQVVIEEMIRRANEQEGSETGFLKHVSTTAHRELDDTLERTMLHWLQVHKLMPAEFKVAAVSEHPVPLPHRDIVSGRGLSPAHEIQDLGSSDYQGGN